MPRPRNGRPNSRTGAAAVAAARPPRDDRRRTPNVLRRSPDKIASRRPHGSQQSDPGQGLPGLGLDPEVAGMGLGRAAMGQRRTELGATAVDPTPDRTD